MPVEDLAVCHAGTSARLNNMLCNNQDLTLVIKRLLRLFPMSLGTEYFSKLPVTFLWNMSENSFPHNCK